MPYELKSLSTRRTLADEAYETLREAIVGGALAAGQVLTDRGLAESLSVSPTPVREALRRLEQDRLVEKAGPRTVKVCAYSPEERAEIGLVEDALLGIAARLAVAKMTDADIDALEALLDQADDARSSMVDTVDAYGLASAETEAQGGVLLGLLREFHERINRASGNTVMLHLIDNVRIFSMGERRAALTRQIAQDDAGPSQRYDDHRRILAAIRARDVELTVNLVSEHNRSARANLLIS